MSLEGETQFGIAAGGGDGALVGHGGGQRQLLSGIQFSRHYLVFETLFNLYLSLKLLLNLSLNPALNPKCLLNCSPGSWGGCSRGGGRRRGAAGSPSPSPSSMSSGAPPSENGIVEFEPTYC